MRVVTLKDPITKPMKKGDKNVTTLVTKI